MIIQYELSADQSDKLKVWVNEINKRIVEEQKAFVAEKNPDWPMDLVESLWSHGHPYQGASRQGPEFRICYTSIGDVCKAEYYGEIIDLTDYENW